MKPTRLPTIARPRCGSPFDHTRGDMIDNPRAGRAIGLSSHDSGRAVGSGPPCVAEARSLRFLLQIANKDEAHQLVSERIQGAVSVNDEHGRSVRHDP